MADTTTATATMPSGQQVIVTHSSALLNDWKTLAWGLAVALAPGAWNWFSSVNWQDYLSPSWAMFVAGAGTVLFRILAAGPVFSGLSVKAKQ